MQKQPTVNANTFRFVFCLAFALIFTIIPWDDIFFRANGYPMGDRDVYEGSILFYNLTTDFLEFDNPLVYFTSEFAWSAITAFMVRDMGMSTTVYFGLISFVVLLAFSYAVAKRFGILATLLLVNPLVIDFAFSQLRLALAVSVLSVVYFGVVRRWFLVAAIALLAISIHTASIIFITIYAMCHFVERYRYEDGDFRRRALVLLLLTGLVIGVATGPLREILLSSLGDRRAEYDDMSSSFLYLSFWLVLFALALIDWRDQLRDFESRYALVILMITAVNAVMGGYATRFLVAAFPFLVIAILTALRRRLPPGLMLFIPYAFIQWTFWLNLRVA